MPKPLPTLALVLALTTAGASAGATPTDGVLDPCTPAAVSGAENETFKDMPPGSAGATEANALYTDGVTQGCQSSPLLFCPSCEISRGALVALVVRAAKLKLVSPAQPTFTDVPLGHPFFAEIETAADAGISLGCSSPGKFCPDAPATRAQAAIFVAKAAGFALPTPATPSFSDVPASHLAYGHVEALKANCVTAGCTATEFCPDNELLRAQAAVFIAKAFDIGETNPCLGPGDAGIDAGSDAGAGGGGGGSGGQWGDSGISPLDGGGASGGTPAAGSEPADEGGCGCSAPGSRAGAPLALALALALALGRRRRVL